MRIVDANVILRYILEDNESLFNQAVEFIEGHEIDTPTEVLCEVVFVLEKVYKVERSEICESLTAFIEETDSLIPYQSAILLALKYYSNRKLDFVDCILAGYAQSEKAEIFTFDKALRKFIDSTVN